MMSERMRTKAVYFFFFANQVFILPWMPLYLMRHVDSAGRLGLLLGTARLVQVAAAPTWGYLADSGKLARSVIFSGCWVMWQTSTFTLCAVASWWYPVDCWWYAATLVTLVARAAVEAPLIPLMDAAVLEGGQGVAFGRARLWGSISWGGLAPAAGLLFQRKGFVINVVFAAILSVFNLTFTVSLLSSIESSRCKSQYGGSRGSGYSSIRKRLNPFRKTAGRRPVTNEVAELESLTPQSTATNSVTTMEGDYHRDDYQKSQSMLNPFNAVDERAASFPRLPKRLSSEARFVLAFLPCVAMFGAGFGFVITFLFVYIKQLGGTSIVCGVALLVECAFEVPSLHVADNLVDRHGAQNVLAVVYALYALRCIGYDVIRLSPKRPDLLVLMVEPLHGITFGLFYTAGVRQAKALLPPDRHNFAQGCFNAAFTAGTGVGALLGGIIKSRYGFSTAFWIFALLFIFTSAASALNPLESSASASLSRVDSTPSVEFPRRSYHAEPTSRQQQNPRELPTSSPEEPPLHPARLGNHFSIVDDNEEDDGDCNEIL